METVIQYLDVIIVSLITGVSGYVISTLNFNRTRIKEKQDSEKKCVDEFIELLVKEESAIITFYESYIDKIPDDSNVHTELSVAGIDIKHIQGTDEQKVLLSKSKYCDELQSEIMRFKVDLFNLLATEDQVKDKSNLAVKQFNKELLSKIRKLYLKRRIVILEFYNSKF